MFISVCNRLEQGDTDMIDRWFDPRHMLVTYIYYLMLKIKKKCDVENVDCKVALKVLDEEMYEMLESAADDIKDMIRGG